MSPILAVVPRRQFLCEGPPSDDECAAPPVRVARTRASSSRVRRRRSRAKTVQLLRTFLPSFDDLASDIRVHRVRVRAPAKSAKSDPLAVNQALLNAGYSNHFLLGSRMSSRSDDDEQPFGRGPGASAPVRRV